MKISRVASRVGTLLFVCAAMITPLHAVALTPPPLSAPAGLSIAEIKMTGNEFVVLQNNTGADIDNLGVYALYYFNKYNPFDPDATSSIKTLPAVVLPVGGSIVLSANGGATCGAAAAGDLGISLGDSSGFLEVVKLEGQNGAVVQQAGDMVSWDAKANGIIQNVPSASRDGAAMYYRYQDGTSYGAWQYADIDSTNPCHLNAVMTTAVDPTTTSGLLASDDSVPGVILSLASSSGGSSGAASLPATDIGLKAPKVSELLPDVASPGSDDSDEFIELYNPNHVSFDLSGFVLQTGSTTSDTRHNYVFPAGSSLPAGGFRAFYSAQTGLSLSNTGGQVWLLDPLLSSIAQSDPYSKPKAGSSWAVAGTTWHFTTAPTPNAANTIKEPSVTAKAATTVAKTTKGTAVTAVATKSSGVAGASATNTAYDTAAKTAPIHLTTLAIVAGIALLYGMYEYRYDVANRYRQFREHRSARG